jgi:hypothetical protein
VRRDPTDLEGREITDQGADSGPASGGVGWKPVTLTHHAFASHHHGEVVDENMDTACSLNSGQE